MYWIFILAFIDASIFPTPVATLFVALTFLNPGKSLKFILFATLGTMTGALAGYLIGHFLGHYPDFEFTGRLNSLHINTGDFSREAFNKIQILFEKWDIWILFIAAYIPFPYFIFSISSGVFQISLPIFLFITLISQGLKFFLLSIVQVKIGAGVKKLNGIKWEPITIITAICIVISIIVIRAI